MLVEAGHRCAIATCRHIDVDVHHITPWWQCQRHEYENLIALCPNCHRRANQGQIDRKSLHIYKANLRYAHDKFSQFEVDMLFECYNTAGGVLWPPYLMLLIKRLLDSKYVIRHEDTQTNVSARGLKLNPDRLVITGEGRQYVDNLRLEQPEQ